MDNRELLEEYSNLVKQLKEECRESGISEEDFKKLYFESLVSLEKTQSINTRPKFMKYGLFILVFIFILCVIYNLKPIYSCIACNIQEYIYPGLRLLRRISIPFISLFPSLTDFYHETCLIQNPFFTVVDMECWPCSSVNNIREIYDPKPVSQHQSAPFIYESQQSIINVESLQELYEQNKGIFEKDASKILKSNNLIIKPNDMFTQYLAGERNIYIWKFNNMNVAKVLRQVIPRPKVVPKFGQSTERFIIVDTSQKLFRIPDTECSFSFLLALSGSRNINLVPAEECKHQCRSLKIELKESYLLWYNWWYWRPVVQPSLGNITFVAHVGSYC